jgi:hypothetical protein
VQKQKLRQDDGSIQRAKATIALGEVRALVAKIGTGATVVELIALLEERSKGLRGT